MGLPRNFSWLEPGKLAGCGAPQSVEHLKALVGEQVSHLVSLSPDVPPPTFPVKGLIIHYIPVEEFKAPSLEQINEFIRIYSEAETRQEAVAVHCRGGNGRTGTMLAAFLVWKRGLEAMEAVHMVRTLRPRAVENRTQEESVLD